MLQEGAGVEIKMENQNKNKKAADNMNLAYGMGNSVVNGYKEIQKDRIIAQNRIRNLVYHKVAGIPFNVVEEKRSEDEQKKLDEEYSDEKLPKLIDKLVVEEKLTEKEKTYLETLVDMANELKNVEERYYNLLPSYIDKEELWYHYYKHMRGIGPSIGAQLICIVGYASGVNKEGKDICPYPSSLRRYCMMDPAGAKGKTRGEKLVGNIKAKTLWYLASTCMIRSGNKTFRKLYTERKQFELARMENEEEGAPKNRLHADFRARRYAIQKFISWHWVIARQLKGYPTNKGWIFEMGEQSKDGERIKHKAENYLKPPIIPEILKDENGEWSPNRPAGWIFKVGHKEWSEADEYIKKICGKANT